MCVGSALLFAAPALAQDGGDGPPGAMFVPVAPVLDLDAVTVVMDGPAIGGEVIEAGGEFLLLPDDTGGSVEFGYTATDDLTGEITHVTVAADGRAGTAVSVVTAANASTVATLSTDAAGRLTAFLFAAAAADRPGVVPPEPGKIKVVPSPAAGETLEPGDVAKVQEWIENLQKHVNERAEQGDPAPAELLKKIKEFGLVIYVTRDDPAVWFDQYDPTFPPGSRFPTHPAGTVDVGDGEGFENVEGAITTDLVTFHALVEQFYRNFPKRRGPYEFRGAKALEAAHNKALIAEGLLLNGYKRKQALSKTTRPNVHGNSTTTWTYQKKGSPTIEVFIVSNVVSGVISVTQREKP